MIETKLYEVINAKVKAVDEALAANQDVGASDRNLAGLFVHDHVWRAIDIDAKPDGIRVARPEGDKGIGPGADKVVEGECAVPVLIYCLVKDLQDDGTAREEAFQRANAIADTLLLYLNNEGLDTQKLYFWQMPVPFARVDHSYNSNAYAVLTMTLSIGECPC